MSALNVNTINGVDVQNLASKVARAWCVWRWVSGVPTIQKAHNVASLTDLGVGRTRINFTVNLPDANYAVVGVCTANLGGTNMGIRATSSANPPSDKTATGIELVAGDGSGAVDVGEANAIFFD